MTIKPPEVLLDPKNKNEWSFDGWRAIPKPNASDEVKKACEEHNAIVMENVDIDDDDEE